MDNTNTTSASPFSSVTSPVIRPRVAETSDREIPIEVVSDSLPLPPSVVEPPIEAGGVLRVQGDFNLRGAFGRENAEFKE